MTGNRLWILGTAVVCIALLALGWLFGVSPKVEQINATKAQLALVQQQNTVAEARVAQLKEQYKNLSQVAAQLDALRVSMPASADYTGFLKELNGIAKSNTSQISSFTPSTPALVSADAASAPAPAATAVALPDGSLVSIPVTLAATGDYADLVSFVGDLQAGGRLFVVSDLSLVTDGGATTATVTGTMYVVIDSSVTSPSDAVSGPQPTQTPAPSATATP